MKFETETKEYENILTYILKEYICAYIFIYRYLCILLMYHCSNCMFISKPALNIPVCHLGSVFVIISSLKTKKSGKGTTKKKQKNTLYITKYTFMLNARYSKKKKKARRSARLLINNRMVGNKQV